MKKVALTSKQIAIFNQLQSEKNTYQAELKKLAKKETDLIVLLAESNSIEIQSNTTVELIGSDLVFNNTDPVDLAVEQITNIIETK